MKRENFKQIIKLRSPLIIDKRRKPYPRLYDVVEQLVISQMNIDELTISENGNLYTCSGYDKEKDRFIIFRDSVNEYCTMDDIEKRIEKLVKEIIE